MAPEAIAFSGYNNPETRVGQRTYVSVQGINIMRRAKAGPNGTEDMGSFWTYGNLQTLPLPNPGEFPGSGEGPGPEEAVMEEAM